MSLSKKIVELVKEHEGGDYSSLIFKGGEEDNHLYREAFHTLECREKVKHKIPEWYDNYQIKYPRSLSVEQSSSQITAEYKSQYVSGKRVADLTGGMGIDSYFFTKVAIHVDYFERDENLFHITKENFDTLSVDNISSKNLEIDLNTIDQLSIYDIIYCDPARRAKDSSRVFNPKDCTPDITELYPKLFEHTPVILVKLSPMIDIKEAARMLPNTIQIDVISVSGECKELVFTLKRDHQIDPENIFIKCINFIRDGVQEFHFTINDESLTQVLHTDKIENYLFEPNSSIIKGGAYKYIASFFRIQKLHPNSHLYTSSEVVDKFPGRVFKVVESYEFKKKKLSDILKKYPKANISTRNFPVSPAELKKLLGTQDGGDIYIFGTTLGNNNRVIIVCKKY